MKTMKKKSNKVIMKKSLKIKKQTTINIILLFKKRKIKKTHRKEDNLSKINLNLPMFLLLKMKTTIRSSLKKNIKIQRTKKNVNKK